MEKVHERFIREASGLLRTWPRSHGLRAVATNFQVCCKAGTLPVVLCRAVSTLNLMKCWTSDSVGGGYSGAVLGGGLPQRALLLQVCNHMCRSVLGVSPRVTDNFCAQHPRLFHCRTLPACPVLSTSELKAKSSPHICLRSRYQSMAP